MRKIAKLVMLVLCTVMSLAAFTACDGAAAFDAERKIAVVAREDGSGTKSAFMELIELKGKPDPSGVLLAANTAAVMATVEYNPQAIAYDSLGYVTGAVKKLKVDGVECTVANVKDGSYKISRPLSIVYKAATITDGINKSFYDFLMSADAQAIINAEGYVSVKDGAAAYTKPGGLSGTINVAGSTSLEPLMKILRDKFQEYHSGVTVVVAAGGSAVGYEKANDGSTDFGMISEEFTQTKAAACTYSIVAKDGIAVIVNINNTFENITKEQLKNIYDKASAAPYTKWSDIK